MLFQPAKYGNVAGRSMVMLIANQKVSTAIGNIDQLMTIMIVIQHRDWTVRIHGGGDKRIHMSKSFLYLIAIIYFIQIKVKLFLQIKQELHKM